MFGAPMALTDRKPLRGVDERRAAYLAHATEVRELFGDLQSTLGHCTRDELLRIARLVAEELDRR